MTDVEAVPQVLIRQFYFPDDYSEVYQLWSNAGTGIHIRRSDEVGEIEKKLQRDPDLFLVAEVGGEIVGSILGGFDGRRGLIYHLAVKEIYRHHGIATHLLNTLEDRLQKKDCIRYYLLVTIDNDEAIQFYEKRGWNRLSLYVYGKDLI
jgi:ribosomal protein S18 acetylase RimI-like enzyme